MITNKNMREQISALADGEVSDASLDAALAMMHDSQSKEDWELYHRIGDVLKSDDLGQTFSSGFAARMAARLDAEAPHVSASPPSDAAPVKVESVLTGGMLATIRRFLVPGMAGTAALLLAIISAPQWMPGSVAPGSGSLLVETADVEPLSSAVVMPALDSASGPAAIHVAQPQTLVPEGDIVRDPRIDQYLMAHQRFSPSAYSSSQFARSATFAAGADK